MKLNFFLILLTIFLTCKNSALMKRKRGSYCLHSSNQELSRNRQTSENFILVIYQKDYHRNKTNFLKMMTSKLAAYNRVLGGDFTYAMNIGFKFNDGISTIEDNKEQTRLLGVLTKESVEHQMSLNSDKRNYVTPIKGLKYFDSILIDYKNKDKDKANYDRKAILALSFKVLQDGFSESQSLRKFLDINKDLITDEIKFFLVQKMLQIMDWLHSRDIIIFKKNLDIYVVNFDYQKCNDIRKIINIDLQIMELGFTIEKEDNRSFNLFSNIGNKNHEEALIHFKNIDKFNTFSLLNRLVFDKEEYNLDETTKESFKNYMYMILDSITNGEKAFEILDEACSKLKFSICLK